LEKSKMDKKNVQNRKVKILLSKNMFCDDNEKLASGDPKFYFKNVTINFYF